MANIRRFSEGKIVEWWFNIDTLGLIQQLRHDSPDGIGRGANNDNEGEDHEIAWTRCTCIRLCVGRRRVCPGRDAAGCSAAQTVRPRRCHPRAPPTAVPPTPVPPTAAPPTPAADLIAPVKAYVAALNAGDVDGALALLTDDVTWVELGGDTAHGKEQLRTLLDWWVTLEAKQQITDCQPQADRVVCHLSYVEACTAAFGATEGWP